MRLLHSNGFGFRIARSTAKSNLKQRSRQRLALMESLEERTLFSVQTVLPATGVASTDMTNIQNAITAAGRGGTVIFPANNTYALSPQGIGDVDNPQAPNAIPLISLPYPVTLQGASDGSSVLLVEGTNGTGNSSTPNDYYSVFATPAANSGKSAGQQNLAGLQMLNLTVNQLGPSVNPMGTGVFGYSSQRYVVYVGSGTTSASPILISGCTFTQINDINTVVLANGGSLNATVTNCTFSQVGGDAPANTPHDNSTVYIGANGLGTTATTGAIVIQNNHFTSAAKTNNNDTLSVSGAVAAVETHGSNIFVLNNTVDGYYRGGNPDNLTGQFSSNQEWTGNTFTNVGQGFLISANNPKSGGLPVGSLGLQNLFLSNNTIQINIAEFSSASNANVASANYGNQGRAAGFYFNKGSVLSMSDITISNNGISWLNPTSVPAESAFTLAQAQQSSGISLPELSSSTGVTYNRLTIANNTIADAFGAGIYLDDAATGGGTINELEIGGNVIVDPAYADDISGDRFQLGNQADAIYLGDSITDAEISSDRFTWNTAPNAPVFNIYNNTTTGGSTDYVGNIVNNGAHAPAAAITNIGPAWTSGPLPGNEYYFTGITNITGTAGQTSFPVTVHGTGPGTVYLVVAEETANANQQETMAPIPVTFTAGVTSINETIQVSSPSQTTGGFGIAISRWNLGALMANPAITRGAPAQVTFTFSSTPAIKGPVLVSQQATPDAQVAGPVLAAQPSGITSQGSDLQNNAVMTDNAADPVSLDSQPPTQFWERRRHGRHMAHRW